MDEELQLMVDRATQIVDPLAADSWAVDCLMLMPTFSARMERERETAERAARAQAARAAQEEAARVAQERAVQARAEYERNLETTRLADEAHRRAVGVLRENERRAREQQQQQRQQQSRTQHADETRLLSPTSTRAVAKRKSGSSIGESGSGSEVEKMIVPRGAQGKVPRKGKETVVEVDDLRMQDPPSIPTGSYEVSKIRFG